MLIYRCLAKLLYLYQMNKICLVAIGLLVSNEAMTQTLALLPQEPQSSGGAINIVTSSLEESEGNTYFAEAVKNERKGELNDAITFFGKAAFEYNSSKLFTRYGEALLRLSNVHFLMAHYSEAEQIVLNVALKNYSRIGSKSGLIESYNQLGRIYLAANKLTQSLWFYTQQGILAKQANNNNAYIESVLGIAQVKIRKKEYHMAEQDLNRAELLAKSSNNNLFHGRIRDARALIPSKLAPKKKA